MAEGLPEKGMEEGPQFRELDPAARSLLALHPAEQAETAGEVVAGSVDGGQHPLVARAKGCGIHSRHEIQFEIVGVVPP